MKPIKLTEEPWASINADCIELYGMTLREVTEEARRTGDHSKVQQLIRRSQENEARLSAEADEYQRLADKARAARDAMLS
jgi:hypothetical protein